MDMRPLFTHPPQSRTQTDRQTDDCNICLTRGTAKTSTARGLNHSSARTTQTDALAYDTHMLMTMLKHGLVHFTPTSRRDSTIPSHHRPPSTRKEFHMLQYCALIETVSPEQPSRRSCEVRACTGTYPNLQYSTFKSYQSESSPNLTRI